MNLIKQPKIKVLYISSVLPDTTCGAHIAIYRHFILRNDFYAAVASFVSEKAEVKNKFIIKRRIFAQKLSRSRFARLYYNFEYLLYWFYLPKSLISFAKAYNPDCIFTVPDTFHPGLAYQLSKKLVKPIVVDFQDLFPVSKFLPPFLKPYSFVKYFLMNRYSFLDKKADYSLYTSEGMMQFFGKESKRDILYPIGDSTITIDELNIENLNIENKDFTIVYAGNCYGSYGKMLLELAEIVKRTSGIHLKIFPVGKGWPEERITEMTKAGIYQKFLPFDELKIELAKADAFLTVMSFSNEDAYFVKTSFTTKWLDYAPYGKPIIVWGPSYASGNVFAKKYQCGLIIENNDPKDVINLIQNTSQEKYKLLGKKAIEVSKTILNPSYIHTVLVNAINNAISQKWYQSS